MYEADALNVPDEIQNIQGSQGDQMSCALKTKYDFDARQTD